MTSTKLEHALALAADGFHVFPLLHNRKTPPKGMTFKSLATRDAEQIRAWFTDPADYNIGIYTGKFGEGGALLVVDVDNKQTRKGRKHGDASLLRLELDGFDLPNTREQHTPTGGRHVVLAVDRPVKQGTNVLGDGLDIRSRGGFIVGAGSVVAAGAYNVHVRAAVARAPEWLVRRCDRGTAAPSDGADRSDVSANPVDGTRAADRAVRFLRDEAGPAIEGAGGDEHSYRVAARLKDFGCTADQAFGLLLEHWNERCSPPWDPDELRTKVRNAYAYGTEAPGAAAPETEFAPVQPETHEKLHPYDEINKDYAIADVSGAVRILHESCDEEGRLELHFMTQADFRLKLASTPSLDPKSQGSIADDWLSWSGRRSFEGVCFRPEQPAPEGWYNLWRGFAFSTGAATHPALDDFLEHLQVNVCGGLEPLYQWLLAYYAHLVQRPWEKPGVALVLRGGKGVGKNVAVERVGALLGKHSMVVDDDRYLLGNFNDHLANMLFLVLDEAAWAGDKKAEGRLKGLITGTRHVIEPKGLKHFTTRNLTRVAILGNEDWLAPSSHDERRFAVFDVEAGRKGDIDFFERMRLGLEAGGYSAMLTFLRQHQAAPGIRVNQAPATKALLDQKHQSLDFVHQWWFACLGAGRLVSSDFGGTWPAEPVDRDSFRGAIARYAREHHIKSWVPNDRSIGRTIRKALPSLADGRGRDGYTYKIPELGKARAEWESFIGHAEDWGS